MKNALRWIFQVLLFFVVYSMAGLEKALYCTVGVIVFCFFADKIENAIRKYLTPAYRRNVFLTVLIIEVLALVVLYFVFRVQ